MKKIQILSLGLFTILLVLTSFKDNSATRYGGTGSARISIYSLIATPSGTKRSEKVSSTTINVTESCTHNDKASAMDAIESSIRIQAGYKTKLLQEWDYDGSIDYRITSCE